MKNQGYKPIADPPAVSVKLNGRSAALAARLEAGAAALAALARQHMSRSVSATEKALCEEP